MGYSPKFIENFQEIVNQLRSPEGDSTRIQVIQYTDDICGACPEKRGELCTSQPRIETLDRNHADVLKLAPGDSLTWGEAKTHIKKSISVKVHHKICDPCPWRDLELCENALIDLINQK